MRERLSYLKHLKLRYAIRDLIDILFDATIMVAILIFKIIVILSPFAIMLYLLIGI